METDAIVKNIFSCHILETDTKIEVQKGFTKSKLLIYDQNSPENLKITTFLSSFLLFLSTRKKLSIKNSLIPLFL